MNLSVLFQGVGKRDYNAAGSNYFSGGSSYAQVTVFKEHLDYWTEGNPNAYYTKPYISGAGNNGSFNAKTVNNTTDYFLQNAAYLRLKNLTLGYDLPESWTNKIKLSKATVFVSGENLFTITNFTKLADPELIDAGGWGFGKTYPLSQTFSVGLSVTL